MTLERLNAQLHLSRFEKQIVEFDGRGAKSEVSRCELLAKRFDLFCQFFAFDWKRVSLDLDIGFVTRLGDRE